MVPNTSKNVHIIFNFLLESDKNNIVDVGDGDIILQKAEFCY